MNKKFALAGILGNALEWYDFALYAYTAPIIAHQFFPAQTPIASLLMAFVAFAGSFLARPIGGAILGHCGDKYGRKSALLISITLMTIATTLIGILPTFNVIGIFAPLFLTLFLLLQGFAVSGEFTGSASFLAEHALQNQRGYIGSWLFASCYAGKLTSAFVIMLVSGFFSMQMMTEWAWRIPFLLSGIFGILILLLRIQSDETQIFKAAAKYRKATKSPALIALKEHKTEILVTALLCSVMSIASYLLVAYFPSFTTTKLGFSTKEATLISTISLLVVTILLPMMGKLSDRIGRKPVIGAGALGFLIFSYPLFSLITQGSFLAALAGEVMLAILLAPVAAPLMATLTETYKTHVRYSGTSIGYNIGLTLFGGTTPLIAIWLENKLNNNLAPSFYLMAGALLTLIAVKIMPETYQKTLTSIE